MKRVHIKEYTSKTYLEDIDENTPIFVKYNGKFYGMVVQEREGMCVGYWIVKVGGRRGAYGHSKVREDLIRQGIALGYEFFIEE